VRIYIYIYIYTHTHTHIQLHTNVDVYKHKQTHDLLVCAGRPHSERWLVCTMTWWLTRVYDDVVADSCVR
jgi:hypothetical protein